MERLAAVSGASPVCISTATLAELEVGCCFRAGRIEAQEDIRRTIRANGLNVLEFSRHTAAEYGALKVALMRQYNREGLNKAAKWPEAWTSPDKGATLGVDEFDLILVSHALERRLVVVTSDPMARILEGIAVWTDGPPFENWLPPA